MSEGPHVSPGHDWPFTIKRLVLGLLGGAMVTALPWLVSKLDIEWLWPIDFLELPGGMVAIILSGGNIHNYNLTVLLAANVVLYAGLIYKLLSVREKRKGSNQNHPPSVV